MPFVRSLGFIVAVSALSAAPAWADPFAFSTGNVDGRMAVASRPSSAGKTEREAADDFTTTQATMITSATFTGLFVGLPGGGAPSFDEVVVEMYRVFPNDSDGTRSPKVPTRVNSPSDVAFDSRDSTAAGGLSFSTAILNPSFAASNSVLNGINPVPNQTTGGDGAVSGVEVQFSVTFSTPFLLPADHYFFVPQVLTSNGNFYWLSAAKPIVAPGTPFAPDLQSWVRSDALDPDWLRVGTDIVGGSTPPTYNMAFSLAGTTTAVAAVPEPESWALMLAGLAGVSACARRGRRGAKETRGA